MQVMQPLMVKISWKLSMR